MKHSFSESFGIFTQECIFTSIIFSFLLLQKFPGTFTTSAGHNFIYFMKLNHQIRESLIFNPIFSTFGFVEQFKVVYQNGPIDIMSMTWPFKNKNSLNNWFSRLLKFPARGRRLKPFGTYLISIFDAINSFVNIFNV